VYLNRSDSYARQTSDVYLKMPRLPNACQCADAHLNFQSDGYLKTPPDVHLDAHFPPPRFRPNLAPWRLLFSRFGSASDRAL